MLRFAIIAAIFASAIAADYCRIDSCKEKGIHTMCKYSTAKPAPACGIWQVQGFSPDEKNEIVRKHNELRQFVAAGKEKRGRPGPQPPAVYMPDLTWDNELEVIAQRWANQCNFAHDACRDLAKYAVGQNLARTGSTGENNSKATDMIQMWYDEVAIFDNRQVKRFTDWNGVGHYTQIVSANSKTIGCGRIMYKDGKWNRYYLVCNYGPTGNILDEPLYKTK